MNSIENIQFDEDLYGGCNHWNFLISEPENVSVFIPIRNADLFSFIRYFNRIDHCHSVIQANENKLVTLFSSYDNIQYWLLDHINIPENIREIYIFCHPMDEDFAIDWVKRYIQIFRTISFNIIHSHKLNYHLLLFAVHRLPQLKLNFPSESLTYRQIHRNYQRICKVLANYFWDEANY